MTEATSTILVAAITAIPPTAVAVVTLIVALRNTRATAEVKQTVVDVKHTTVAVADKLGEVSVQIDGKMDKLLKQTAATAHAEGKAEGVEKERARNGA